MAQANGRKLDAKLNQGLNQPPPNCIRVLLEITVDKDARIPNPCFKSDGQRFSMATTTLKLLHEGMYNFTLVLSPQEVVQRLELVNRGSGLTEPVELALSEGKKDDTHGITTYITTWKCNLDWNLKNTRHELELYIHVEGFGTLVLPIQLKVYSPGDKSLTLGTRLRYFQYLFKRTSDEIKMISMSPFSL
ncbi:hypothetical protein CEUSTIGMA_g2909.t1 [Chlamydomonas eustigma]|uniref:Uncharacterized protein n=1 Tax=Chlamydomonas eustigma TaxID=1157962 RepID=A0A250WXF5_9CHLO|nr:hypothetical protein CEUSTIGMA_g2909.t1 [Chlamydomonas eustigma]|eukprot:GAX75466.1 hypothetical protein CEUSTIGMA_g2909.t1 [Chlamydomonas eustigma]